MAPKQKPEIRGEAGQPVALYREMELVIDREALEARAAGDAQLAATDLIPIAISSEAPVLRYDWWTGDEYYEVLDHSPASVDLSYARDGMPYLLEHKSVEQHGLIENVRISPDRKLRGDLRMSRAQRSQEIRQDILDGIRKKVSVGYITGDAYEQTPGQNGGAPTRRFTQWMPFEGSGVSVPADYTVGYGRNGEGADAPPRIRTALLRFSELHPLTRSARRAEEPTMEPTPAATPAAPNVTDITERATQAAEERASNIAALANQHGCNERLAGWLKDRKTVEQVSREINDILADRLAKPVKTVDPIELSERENRQFSMARAILHASGGAIEEARGMDFGFERELMQEAQKRTPFTAGKGGTLIPLTTIKGRANVDSATSTTGGPFKFTQPGDFIELLRNATSVLRAGATVLAGLTGPVTFPKQNAAATGTWVGENPGSDMSRSNLTTTTVSLAFKTIQSASAVSRQALFSAASGNYDLEQIIRNDMARVIALAIDLGALNGSGSANQPLGLLQDTNVGTAPTLGTNGGTMAWGNWVDLETAVGDANAMGRLAYLTNTKQRGIAKKSAVLGNTAGAVPIWGGVIPGYSGAGPGSVSSPISADGVVNGYPALASNQVPRNLTKGTATTVCSAVIFGAFEHLLVGMFGAGFEILIDPYTLKLQNMIDITAWNFVDVANRYPVAFATLKDAL